jgi:hypothetical protein
MLKEQEHISNPCTHMISAQSYSSQHLLLMFSFVEGALSYFVAGNDEYSEDKGFAIKGWTKVRFENEGIIINGKSAIAMGNYFFMTPEGDEVKVEFSFGYIVDSDGSLRINLHHSSIPANLE